MIKINFGKYEIVAEAWEDSRAWGHRAILLKDGYSITEKSHRYFNRTWESWTYQSVCLNVIDQEIETIKRSITSNLKRANGWEKITKSRKLIIDAELKENADYKDLKAIYNNLMTKRYN